MDDAEREEVLVGRSSDITQEGLLAQLDDGREIGVFRVKGNLVAYENRCRHQGGPVCSGEIMGRYEQVLADDMTVVGERFNDDEPHLVCPWHGWEYKLESGECAANPRFKLRAFEVVQRDDDVFVLL